MEDQLRSGHADLAIVPREVMRRSADLSTRPLFRDRYVLAVGGDNQHVSDSVTLEEFSAQPYLAYDLEPLGSVAEKQLDVAGITRRHDVSIESFLLAPYLLQGTRLLSLVHERLARMVQQHLDIRILEPPIDLPLITEVMAWSTRREEDPAHRWLRDRLHDVAARL